MAGKPRLNASLNRRSGQFPQCEVRIEVAYVGWNESVPGDKAVRKELRSTLKTFGLPPTGAVFDRAYEYVKENY